MSEDICIICGGAGRGRGTSLTKLCAYCMGPLVIDTSWRPIPSCCLWPEPDKELEAQLEVLYRQQYSNRQRLIKSKLTGDNDE